MAGNTKALKTMIGGRRQDHPQRADAIRGAVAVAAGPRVSRRERGVVFVQRASFAECDSIAYRKAA